MEKSCRHAAFQHIGASAGVRAARIQEADGPAHLTNRKEKQPVCQADNR